MDGTFEYCAKHFYQLYTLHGLVNTTYIPLLYVLLPNKTCDTYVTLLKKLKEMGVSPSMFVVDFERAAHKAIKIVYPLSQIRGCKFHLGQAWFRKIQQIGLSVQYKDASDEIGKWLVYMFGLCFLSPEEVSDCFVEDFVAIKPDNKKLDEFCDYLVDTYISEESVFPPEMWARASSDLFQTTNACESFHAELNSNFYHHHPHIFSFIEVLTSLQTNSYIKIRSAGLNIHQRRNKKARSNEEFIETQLQDYLKKNLARVDFVKSVAYRNKIS